VFGEESRVITLLGMGVGGEEEPVSRSRASRVCHSGSLDSRRVRKVGFQTEIKAKYYARSRKSKVT
jgi:hypothetical protein